MAIDVRQSSRLPMTYDARYSPPQAAVEDPPEVQRGERPRNVSLAMKLLWASFALGIPSAVHGYLDTPAWWFVAVTLLVTTFAVFLYLKLASGRNWARIVLTALVALGSLARAAPAEPRLVVLQVLDFSCLALELVAVWLLFTRDAAAWFRPVRLTG